MSGSYDMQGHGQKCVERNCESANKTTDELHNVSTPCLHDHPFVKELSEVSTTNRVEMPVCSSRWPTGHLMDREICGKACDEMQQSMR